MSVLVPRLDDDSSQWCWVHHAFRSQFGSVSLVVISKLRYLADGDRHGEKFLVRKSFSPSTTLSPLLSPSSE